MVNNKPSYRAVGARIRRLREAKGLSRGDVATLLKVDVTSLVGWEAGRRLPRDKQRHKLAEIFGTDLDTLFVGTADEPSAPIAAKLVDTVDELPHLLNELIVRARKSLRALRLAAPYTTAAYIQQEFRTKVSERILADTLVVERIEIFYDLRRLQETLSNILRYEGHAYHVKSYCAGVPEVVPAMGGYFFDDSEFLIGAYWTGMPPTRRPGMRVSGRPFQTFFTEYWDEIWRRGTLLNLSGSHDLSAVQEVAFKLGLQQKNWKKFVEEARELRIGDGAPPLV
ncbi:MAG TPA: helix-turn-helix transcriptional regulator [Pyrinomonadaceae bacterium]|nr:helix-turn-helix transcriptional regulator [Pyrinomonadaceae bacterium]